RNLALLNGTEALPAATAGCALSNAQGEWRPLRRAKVAVHRRGTANDLHQVRETPRAAERWDDLASEQRPIHDRGPSLHRWLRPQHGVTAAPQFAGATLGHVAGTQ